MAKHPSSHLQKKHYQITIDGESYTLKFGLLATQVIERRHGSLKGFLVDFAKGEDGPFITCLVTATLAGLAHSGLTESGIDDAFTLDGLGEAAGDIVQSFWDAYGLPTSGDADAEDGAEGEGEAAPEAA